VKTTIDIPDELYRRVKAKSALAGKRVREVTIELYERWLGDSAEQAPKPSPQAWLDEWVQTGNERLRDAPDRPTATEILEEDRSRLESR
jgi:hypothetical protein